MEKLYFRGGKESCLIFVFILLSLELEPPLCPEFQGAALAWVMGGPSITLLRRDLSQLIPSTSLVLPLINTITD